MDLKTPRHRYFHSFCIRPDVRFDAQEDNEEVILVLRAHPITQIPWIAASALALFILIFLNFFFPAVLNARQIIFANFLGLVLILSYIWLNILLYIFNVGIISTKRVLDIDFYSILYREVSETRLIKVEDITSKEGGYFGSFFNYGNVFVQTAGSDTNIEFLNIPDPANAVKIINHLSEEAEEKKP